MVAVPLDGRLTSQNPLSPPLTGGELLYIVSPGNAAQGNSYKVTLQVLAAFIAAYPVLNEEVILSGATSGTPFMVGTADTRVLFNKTIGAASFATMPLANTMVYPNGVLFKDIKGDADVNPISINFTAGQLCDGLSTVTIGNAYGWITINPLPNGTGWYQTS